MSIAKEIVKQAFELSTAKGKCMMYSTSDNHVFLTFKEAELHVQTNLLNDSVKYSPVQEWFKNDSGLIEQIADIIVTEAKPEVKQKPISLDDDLPF